MSTLFFRSLTGSRLHGLHTEESDYDWKDVTLSPLQTIISPFHTDSGTQKKEGTDDVCSYELRHFVKLLVACNPTILEVISSTDITYNLNNAYLVSELKDARFNFLSSTRVYYAHRGYASDQKRLFENPNASPQRIIKASVAYIRIMHQGIDLLRTGRFSPYIEDDKLRMQLLRLKYNFDFDKDPERVLKEVERLENELTLAYEQSTLPRNKIDVTWLEEFLVRAYSLGK